MAHGQDTTLTRKLRADTLFVKYLEEVIVSASRVREKILQSPVSVEKVSEGYFRSNAAFSFFDALENIKGVQMITPSLGFRILNTRGFSNTTNVRFVQMVDGMDIQSPHIGSPIGSSLGPGDLDVENVEILPGVASALYGMNTTNGLANITTRNPFTSPGFSFQQKTAIMHLGGADSSPKLFSETSLRFAHIISPKLSFKVNAAFSKGYDWVANNYTDLNSHANRSTNLVGTDNPATDPVNSYGNESANRRTISLQGKNYVVGRTGYSEKEVVDYSLQNIKGDAGIYYKVSSTATISYLFHFAYLNTVYQRGQPFSVAGLFFAATWNAVPIRISTGQDLRKSGKHRQTAGTISAQWRKTSIVLLKLTIHGMPTILLDLMMLSKRAFPRQRPMPGQGLFADAGRLMPGTIDFDNALDKLQKVNNWDSGAAVRVKAAFVQAELQWNMTESWLKKIKRKRDWNYSPALITEHIS